MFLRVNTNSISAWETLDYSTEAIAVAILAGPGLLVSNMNKGMERDRGSTSESRGRGWGWGSHWHLQFKVVLRLHIHNSTLSSLVTSSLCELWAQLWVTEWLLKCVCVCVCLSICACVSFNLYLPKESWQSCAVFLKHFISNCYWELANKDRH